MAQGKIARIQTERGFGFITPDETNGKDVFFHFTALSGDNKPDTFADLQEGQTVRYDVTDGDKGPRATNVAPA